MGVKKRKLVVDYPIDFDLIGLISTVKDYKLAWLINQALNISMIKEQEMVLRLVGQKPLHISHYKYEGEYGKVRLIKNKDVAHTGMEKYYLAPEMSQFDYFLLSEGEVKLIKTPDLVKRLKEIREVEFSTVIEPDKLKSRDNFIFE